MQGAPVTLANTVTAASVSNATSTLDTYLANLLGAVGLPATYDLVATAFTADHTEPTHWSICCTTPPWRDSNAARRQPMALSAGILHFESCAVTKSTNTRARVGMFFPKA
ncbi:hypothetical protein WL32_20825 [Burkholderia cepacia]|nr:hypothetical protein WL32_20825 [Burkholderia cepacia]